MQRCECTVRLGGDITNTVHKVMVSPAEIVILRHIHGGDDAVVDIKPTGMDNMPHANERDRLNYTYGKEVVEKVFPGSFAKLPVTLKDIGHGRESEDDAEEESEEESSDQEKEVVTRMEAMDPKPGVEDDLSPDDKALIAMIQEAKSTDELRAIAEDNEVDVTSLPKKVPDIKVHLIRSLFPMYQK